MIRLGNQTDWTKASYTTPANNCVIVRSTQLFAVQVSDSKLAEDGRPLFALSPTAFTALVDFARSHA